MGQQASNGRQNLMSQRNYTTKKVQKIKQKRLDHQGILKLRSVPFKNCVEIQNQQAPLFLQEAQITLKDLLDCRLYTNKLFPIEDVQKLIEHITYTLAYMQENSVSYKNVNSQYVYYQNGNFKLLPNQLIPQTIYERFKRTISEQPVEGQILQFAALSPQMIIAFRCKEPRITDKQILDKSNVFCLGMMLLEACTLLPSRECYDTETFDIIDETVTERINLVQDYYNSKICKIVANMLDYDYSQRMDLKQASIFVNRQLNQSSNSAKKSSTSSQVPKTKQNQSGQKSRVTIDCSNQEYSEQKNPSVSLCTHTNKDESIRKKSKKNQIYLTTKFDQNQPQKFQQKNSSSINHTKSRVSGALSQLSINSISSSQLKPNPQRSIKTNDVYRKPTENLSYLKPSNYKQHRPYQRQIQSQNENPYKVCKNSTYQYYEKDSPERKYGGNPEYSDYRNQNNNKYRYYEDDTFSRDEPDSQRKYQEDYIEEPYKNYYENSKTQEIKKRNQSRINLYQRQNSQNENNQSERYSQYSPNSQQHASFGKPSTKYAQQPVYTKGGDHSLTRIKNQIQKSRKLIQQFKKSQIPRF